MPLNELLSSAAQKGAELRLVETCPKMCMDCAFRKGSEANNDEAAVDAAADCLSFYGKFNCHKIIDGQFVDEGIPCAGFLYAKAYMENTEIKDRFEEINNALQEKTDI